MSSKKDVGPLTVASQGLGLSVDEVKSLLPTKRQAGRSYGFGELGQNDFYGEVAEVPVGGCRWISEFRWRLDFFVLR